MRLSGSTSWLALIYSLLDVLVCSKSCKIACKRITFATTIPVLFEVLGTQGTPNVDILLFDLASVSLTDKGSSVQCIERTEIPSSAVPCTSPASVMVLQSLCYLCTLRQLHAIINREVLGERFLEHASHFLSLSALQLGAECYHHVRLIVSDQACGEGEDEGKGTGDCVNKHQNASCSTRSTKSIRRCFTVETESDT